MINTLISTLHICFLLKINKMSSEGQADKTPHSLQRKNTVLCKWIQIKLKRMTYQVSPKK